MFTRRLGAVAIALTSVVSLAAMTQAQLRSVISQLDGQGYTNIETVRETDRVRVRAKRGDSVRELIYDAETDELLSDVTAPMGDRDRLQDQDRLRDGTGDGVPDRDRDRDGAASGAGGSGGSSGGGGRQ